MIEGIKGICVILESLSLILFAATLNKNPFRERSKKLDVFNKICFISVILFGCIGILSVLYQMMIDGAI